MINMTKINNAIAESISNSTRPLISLRAPDIYAVTSVIDSPDAAAIQFGPSWHVDGTTDDGESFELSIAVVRDYSEYEVQISNHPMYFGVDRTEEDGDRLATAICELVESEFPGIQTELWTQCYYSATTGPNQDTVDAITEWIELNWITKL